MRNPGAIKNKAKRIEVYARYKAEKKRQAKERRLLRSKEAEALGADVEPEAPKTIEGLRVYDETFVEADDEEILGDERDDEFATYWSGGERPKVMVTTRPKPSGELFHCIADLQKLVPNCFFYPRRHFTVQQICGFASNKNFTHLIVLSERYKECNGMIITHLPIGPTAFFKVSNVLNSQDVPGRGAVTDHVPEILLNNFRTRLGRRVGRLLGSIFPHAPEFQGRQVVTMHNQRDFIFVRHHRYIFNEREDAAQRQKEKQETVKTRLQELGPRFTIKMKWLQEGVFDSDGEYEWMRRPHDDKNRRAFFL